MVVKCAYEKKSNVQTLCEFPKLKPDGKKFKPGGPPCLKSPWVTLKTMEAQDKGKIQET